MTGPSNQDTDSAVLRRRDRVEGDTFCGSLVKKSHFPASLLSPFLHKAHCMHTLYQAKNRKQPHVLKGLRLAQEADKGPREGEGCSFYCRRQGRVAVWELVLKENFAEEETLKLNISIPEPAHRYKQKQANFSKASFLNSNWLWPPLKEADRHTCYPSQTHHPLNKQN